MRFARHRRDSHGVGYFRTTPNGARTAAKVFDIDCNDAFEATGGQTAVGKEAGTYAVACTFEGKPMPWKSLGEFHAAPMARNSWDKYRAKVTEKASEKGCPGVAIRKAPPTKNQQGEAIGAWCVEL